MLKYIALPLAFALAAAFLLLGCSSQSDSSSRLPAGTESSIANGRRLIASYGCGSCHIIPGVPGADATIGPPLENFYRRHYIAGLLWNTPDNLAQWIQNPQQIKQGTAMPNLGVSQGEARDMAAYLEHQQDLGDWLGQSH